MTTPATTASSISATTQVYRVFIKTTPQAVWDAIVDPEWTQKYGYGGYASFDLRPGGHFESKADQAMQDAGMPAVVVTGEVISADPPKQLVQTWKPMWLDEPATRLTYDIADCGNGVTSLTLTHELEGAPMTAAQVGWSGEVHEGGGGWSMVLSDLKSLLETGQRIFG